MLLESLMNMVRGVLRIPPGTSLRKASGPSTTSSSEVENDYIDTILDITKDDICIGDTPLSINFDSRTPKSIALKLNQINDELNTIVKWVAKDLCKKGYSLYKTSISKQNKLILLPYLEDVEFYITKEKEVVVYNVADNSKVNVKDLLIFINYDKDSLQNIEDTGLKSNTSLSFRVEPTPMQIKVSDRTMSAINSIEDSYVRDRALRRPARWVNVDIGVAQGDKQQSVVDTIGSAINASSESLSQSNTYEFDDNLPIIPNRRGIGKPEIVESIPDSSKITTEDLNYFIGKLSLQTKFPSSYIDFSKELGQSAVSLIRGDVRYSKMCSSVRSKIVTTCDDFVNSSTKFSKYHPSFLLTVLPSSEDDDVIQALDSYVDLSSKVEEFVNAEEASVELKLHRLKLLQDLFAGSTYSPSLQKWFEDYRTYIISTSNMDQEEGDMDGSNLSPGVDELDSETGPDLDTEPDVNNEESDVEFLEPHSDEL